MTVPYALAIAADFIAATIIAFASGYLTARALWWERGYRAGLRRAGAPRAFREEPTGPTVLESRR